MSLHNIIEELPNLTHQERRELGLRLLQFETDDELALVTVIPHTTSLRGNLWEVKVNRPFLKPGAFHAQQIQLKPTRESSLSAKSSGSQ